MLAPSGSDLIKKNNFAIKQNLEFIDQQGTIFVIDRRKSKHKRFKNRKRRQKENLVCYPQKRIILFFCKKLKFGND